MPVKRPKTPKEKANAMEAALAYFQAGNSLRKCSELTGIEYSKIRREAEKRNIKKGELQQLIEDKTKSDATFATLTPQQKEVVADEVAKRVKLHEFFENATMKNLSVMMKKVDTDTDFAEHLTAQNALAKGKETVFGKQIETAVQVNNNVKDDKVITIERSYG